MPGWTWEYVEENVTLPRLETMVRDWKRYPPVHIAVAAYFGFGKDETTKQIDQGGEAADEFVQMVAESQSR